MSEKVPAEIAAILTEFVEKVGLLRRDMQHKKELEKDQARMQRIEQKLSALAERVSVDDPDLAKAIRTAWQMPARSLAFRNATHQNRRVSGWWYGNPAPTVLVLWPHRLIRQVALVAHLLDLMELRLEPVHVLFFVLQKLREQLA